MAKYIDADKLKNTAINTAGDDLIYYLPWFVDIIDAQPTADVRENVRGTWTNLQISITGGSCADCSKCGATVYNNFTSTINFCPICGADMRGKENE